MEYNIGDKIEMKKPHPCGSKTWEITRVGVDFKFKCLRMRACACCHERKSFENDEKENLTFVTKCGIIKLSKLNSR